VSKHLQSPSNNASSNQMIHHRRIDAENELKGRQMTSDSGKFHRNYAQFFSTYQRFPQVFHLKHPEKLPSNVFSIIYHNF